MRCIISYWLHLDVLFIYYLLFKYADNSKWSCYSDGVFDFHKSSEVTNLHNSGVTILVVTYLLSY